MLEAAAAVFLELGVDAPVREVARRANVGTGTLYRHFPTRADLIQGVFRREVDACVDMAARLAATRAPFDALEEWLYYFMRFVATKRGLGPALHSDASTYGALPAYFLGSMGPALQDLLDAATTAGDLDVRMTAEDLLLGVSRLCTPGPTDQDHLRLAELFVPVLLRGMSPSRTTGSSRANPA